MNDINELAAALAKANSELKNPKKDAKADLGQYSYAYATLDQILAGVRPVLAKHGLSVMQDVTLDEGRLAVTTTLLHASGQWLSFGPLTGPSGANWQQLGGGITYARRYALTAALGLAADEDNDAQQPKVQVQPLPPAAPEQDPDVAPVQVPGSLRGPAARAWVSQPATQDQKKLLGILVRKAGYKDTVTFLADDTCRKILGGAPTKPLVKGHASQLIDALQEWEADDAADAQRQEALLDEPDDQERGEEYEASRP